MPRSRNWRERGLASMFFCARASPRRIPSCEIMVRKSTFVSAALTTCAVGERVLHIERYISCHLRKLGSKARDRRSPGSLVSVSSPVTLISIYILIFMPSYLIPHTDRRSTGSVTLWAPVRRHSNMILA